MTRDAKAGLDSEPLLVSSAPTASAPADVHIAHIQLRNLVVCPRDRGVVWYVSTRCIVEHDIVTPNAHPNVIAQLRFTPVTIAALALDGNRVLLATGGQDAELYLGLYSYMSSPPTEQPAFSTESGIKSNETHVRHSELIWSHFSELPGSINNSVMLYSPPSKASVEVDQDEWPGPSELRAKTKCFPRLVVSNNDCSVKFFDVSTAKNGFRCQSADPRPYRNRDSWGREYVVRFEQVGHLKLAVPVNHTSISPDGSTLLSCGDSATVYLHRIISNSDCTPLGFEPLATYALPVSTLYTSPSSLGSSSMEYPAYLAAPPINPYLPYAFVDGVWTLAGAPTSSCFSTAWNEDGTKFAVASQEGMVVVWDVRSGAPLPMARWETKRGDERAKMEMGSGSLVATVAAHPSAWFENANSAPAWGVRSLKFAKNGSGKEVLVFTEHASQVHVIDADTFEHHDVIRIPHVRTTPYDSIASVSPYTPEYLASFSALNIFPRAGSDHGYIPRSAMAILGSSASLGSHSRVLSDIQPYSRSPERMHSPLSSPGPLSSTFADAGWPGVSVPRSMPSPRRRPQFSMHALTEPQSSNHAARDSGLHDWDDDLMEDDIAYYASQGRRERSVSDSTDEEANIIVIPPMLNAEAEAEVRNLLALHGLTAIPSSPNRLQVPERRVRRVPSPPSEVQPQPGPSGLRGFQRSHVRREQDGAEGDDVLSDLDCTTPPLPTNGARQPSSQDASSRPAPVRSHTLPPCRDLIDSTDRLDIAGVSFDKSGAYMYVATVDGITEWTMKGADMKWWCSGGWV